MREKLTHLEKLQEETAAELQKQLTETAELRERVTEAESQKDEAERALVAKVRKRDSLVGADWYDGLGKRDLCF